MRFSISALMSMCSSVATTNIATPIAAMANRNDNTFFTALLHGPGERPPGSPAIVRRTSRPAVGPWVAFSW
jgi:hypothetical protein